MTNTTPHIRRIAPAGSLMQQLEAIVESDVVWGLAEQLEAFHQSRGTSYRHQYTLMDILVTSAAAQLCGSDRAAIRLVKDPSTWRRLCDAAAAVPNDSFRRLSPRAPSRSQLYRARQNHFSGDALNVLKRGLRAAAVRTAADLRAFDPSAGTWTRPDESQCVVGDATWIPVSDSHGKGPRNRYVSAGESGNGPRPAVGRELVVLSCRDSDGSEPIVLDADLGEGAVSGTGCNDADRAAAMLRRLLEEHSDTLRPGLRGLVYDMAMTSKAFDQVLDMGVLPITKVPRSPGGGHQSVNLGTCLFTGADGTQHDHEVVTINGAPAVVLTDSGGEETIVPLCRQQIRWENSRSRHVAYGHYAMPDTPPVPTHLRGASTVIRINSLDNETASRKRRTRALRAIPEGDADFGRLYDTRENVESIFADIKRGAGRLRGSRDSDFQIVVCQMLSIARAIAARHTHGKAA